MVLQKFVSGVLVPLLAACSSPGTFVAFDDVAEVPRNQGDVVTLIDLLEAGHAGALQWAAAHEPAEGEGGLEDLLARLEPLCVRVEARVGTNRDAFAVQAGSGLLVGDGRWVLASGHVLAGEGLDPWVVLADGRAFRARVRSMVDGSDTLGDADWALLELDGDPGLRGWSGELAPARRGDLAFVLGYPSGNTGRDGRGKVVIAPPSRDGRANALAPMVMVARVDARGPELAPLAGPIVQGGMSGGPIFDLRGRLLGVVASSGAWHRPSGIVHSVTGSGPESLRKRLAALTADGGS